MYVYISLYIYIKVTELHCETVSACSRVGGSRRGRRFRSPFNSSSRFLTFSVFSFRSAMILASSEFPVSSNCAALGSQAPDLDVTYSITVVSPP